MYEFPIGVVNGFVESDILFDQKHTGFDTDVTIFFKQSLYYHTEIFLHLLQHFVILFILQVFDLQYLASLCNILEFLQTILSFLLTCTEYPENISECLQIVVISSQVVFNYFFVEQFVHQGTHHQHLPFDLLHSLPFSRVDLLCSSSNSAGLRRTGQGPPCLFALDITLIVRSSNFQRLGLFLLFLGLILAEGSCSFRVQGEWDCDASEHVSWLFWRLSWRIGEGRTRRRKQRCSLSLFCRFILHGGCGGAGLSAKDRCFWYVCHGDYFIMLN